MSKGEESVFISVLNVFRVGHTVWGVGEGGDLEDPWALAPVLSVLGLPVPSPVHVTALSQRIVCSPLKPQWLVAFYFLA